MAEMKNTTGKVGNGGEAMVPAWLDGVLTPVEKYEVHKRGLKHKAVSVFVTSRGKVLLQRRALGKYHPPGLWANTCCTHPFWGEAPEACAVRRLEEEMGIAGLSPVHRGQIEYRADVGGGLTEHEVVEVYRAEAPAGLVPEPDPAEVAAIRWIDLYDLRADLARHPERYTPWLRIYMQDHAEALFGDLMQLR